MVEVVGGEKVMEEQQQQAGEEVVYGEGWGLAGRVSFNLIFSDNSDSEAKLAVCQPARLLQAQSHKIYHGGYQKSRWLIVEAL